MGHYDSRRSHCGTCGTIHHELAGCPRAKEVTSKANDRQPGGDHYKRTGELQHWDLCAHVGPMEYAATKYLARWPHKNGVDDLQKAEHYLAKLLEQVDEGVRRPLPPSVSDKDIDSFNEGCQMNPLTLLAFRFVCTWEVRRDLLNALVLVRQLVEINS